MSSVVHVPTSGLIESPERSNIFGQVRDTEVRGEGRIEIQGVGKFKFSPQEIRSVRHLSIS